MALGLLVCGNAQAASPLYKVTDLGDLPGGDSHSIAWAINEQGQVVGRSDTAFNTQFGDDGLHGFIWDAQNGMRDLGIFSNQRYGEAYGINESGMVVGVRGGQFRGFAWTESSGLVDLGLSGGYPYSQARAVNDSGYIVEENWNFSGPPSRVYLRSPNGSRLDIGTAAGVPSPRVGDINNANQIVGNNYGAGSAYRWDPATGMTVIAPFSGGTQAYGSAINEAGTVAGFSNMAGGFTHPFIWDSANGMRDLGTLNAALPYGSASDINDANVVVGSSVVASNIDHAFIWDGTSGLRDLNDFLLDSAGWQYLSSATAINNAGQIVGYGVLTNGDTHAFILDPVNNVPEPASLFLTLIGSVGLAFRRRKSAL